MGETNRIFLREDNYRRNIMILWQVADGNTLFCHFDRHKKTNGIPTVTWNVFLKRLYVFLKRLFLYLNRNEASFFLRNTKWGLKQDWKECLSTVIVDGLNHKLSHTTSEWSFRINIKVFKGVSREISLILHQSRLLSARISQDSVFRSGSLSCVRGRE